LAVLYPRPELHLPASAPLVAMQADSAETGDQATQAIGTAEFDMPGTGAGQLHVHLKPTPEATSELNVALPQDKGMPDRYNGFPAVHWNVSNTSTPAGAPAQLTLDQLLPLVGGRIPIGLNPAAHPGPYQAAWQQDATTTVWAAHGTLLAAQNTMQTVVTLSGGGLTTPRTLAVSTSGPASAGWSTSGGYHNAVVAQLNQWSNERTDWQFWGMALPAALWLLALLMALRTLVRPASRRPSGGLPSSGKTASRSA
jgi:high-affinity iron transporter